MEKLLYKINSPEELKKLSIKELNTLSQEIREFLIDSISKTGGHLSSNLGVIEATIAMHYVFDSPKDKIIFDVGHQCYTHKILTGRINEFNNFRSINSISGFPKYSESIHDVYETGHSSTSISAMCGFLEEKKRFNEINEVIAFIGDGSIQSGLALAGINFLASAPKQKGIIIINDNEMSISKNVGGFAKYFNKVRIRKSFAILRKMTTVNFRKNFKSLVYRDVNLFGQLKYTYLGPIDGHDIEDLIKYFEYAKKSTNSIIIHLKTTKGKGYKYACSDTLGMYHGIGPFDVATGEVLNKPKADEITFSNGIGEILIEEMDLNEAISVITPAMIYGTGLTKVFKKYPDRVIDVGICEENAVVMASSMSLGKTIPIVITYATFFQRAYDQLLHDISRTNSFVIFLGDRSGIVGYDGDTHQGIFDIGLFNSLPNFIIAAPSNLIEAKQLIKLALIIKKPIYIRYPKAITKNYLDEKYLNNQFNPLEFNQWIIIKDISKKNIITYGNSLNKFNSELSKHNIGLINAIFIKPIDTILLKKLKGRKVYVYEDTYMENNLGTKIIEYSYLHNLDIKIKKYQITNFVGIGSVDEILEYNNLDITNVLKEILGD